MPTFKSVFGARSVLIIGRVSGYEYDIFISYSRYGSVQKWILNHFHAKLMDCLADEIAPTPRVYIDRLMERAVHWPSSLQRALHRSKIMLQVLAPPYFESEWCQAEWHSMRERQSMLGLAGLDVPQGLIYSVLYGDSDSFPIEARESSWVDFKDFANPDLAFRKTKKYGSFHWKVRDLARDLVELLPQVPEWQPDWPLIVKPDPVLRPVTPMPRFRR
jgi:hypothetical protein